MTTKPHVIVALPASVQKSAKTKAAKSKTKAGIMYLEFDADNFRLESESLRIYKGRATAAILNFNNIFGVWFSNSTK